MQHWMEDFSLLVFRWFFKLTTYLNNPMYLCEQVAKRQYSMSLLLDRTGALQSADPLALPDLDTFKSIKTLLNFLWWDRICPSMLINVKHNCTFEDKKHTEKTHITHIVCAPLYVAHCIIDIWLSIIIIIYVIWNNFKPTMHKVCIQKHFTRF